MRTLKTIVARPARSALFLAVAVALTLWSGWEFYRDVWRQRHALRGRTDG